MIFPYTEIFLNLFIYLFISQITICLIYTRYSEKNRDMMSKKEMNSLLMPLANKLER